MQPGDTLMPRLQWHYNTVHSLLRCIRFIGPGCTPAVRRTADKRGFDATRDWPECGTGKTALKRLCIEIRDTVRDRTWARLCFSLSHIAWWLHLVCSQRHFLKCIFSNTFAADDCGTFAYEKINSFLCACVVYDIDSTIYLF